MQNIKSRWPDAEIAAFTMNPDDTRLRHGIPSFRLRRQTWTIGGHSAQISAAPKKNLRDAILKTPVPVETARFIYRVFLRTPKTIYQELAFLGSSFRIITSFDIVVIAGGGQLLDWGGPWQFPYTLFKWILLARLAKVKCFALNLGAGPITHRLSKFFIKKTLSLVDHVSFRDDESRQLLKRLGFKGISETVADTVYSLEVRPLPTRAPSRRRSARKIVGIAPMPYGDPRSIYEQNDGAYASFIDTLARFAAWLVERDYGVTIFCTDIGIDPSSIHDLMKALDAHTERSRRDLIHCPSIASNAELFAAMQKMAYVVTPRFHGVVFAHLLNIPVIAIAHHPKVRKVMQDVGLEAFCLDLDNSTDTEKLKRTFESLVAGADGIRSTMEEKTTEYKMRLQVQFDRLFPVAAFDRQLRGCTQ